MIRQTIRTFYQVKDGAVEILCTDPVLTPLTMRDKEKLMKEGEKDGKGCIDSGTEKRVHGG